mmetsp:Transcript_7571/g.22131  ORF Transcript_7571/g.22131 Transcript_7571/m.22131 type:complete len:288 (-) Transcript_7571:180-1043(-)
MATSTAARRLALARLPTIVFPGSPLTLKVFAEGSEVQSDDRLAIASSVLRRGEDAGGQLVASMPFQQAHPDLGVKLVLEEVGGDLAHFTVGDRVRFAPGSVPALDAGGAPKEVEFERVSDRAEFTTAEVIERAEDEAALARSIVNLGAMNGILDLALGLDELGVEHVELCHHPKWAASKVLPKDALGLSMWLPARLPLTTELKAQFLFAFSPLWRLQNAIDVMRFLASDPLNDERYTHRFQRILDSPATGVCGHGWISKPRCTVGLARGDAARDAAATSPPTLRRRR